MRYCLLSLLLLPACTTPPKQAAQAYPATWSHSKQMDIATLIILYDLNEAQAIELWDKSL